MSLLPRNTETLCHRCAAHMVTADTTDALQDAVADWLRRYDVEGMPCSYDYPAHAAELLALIARTARSLPRIDNDPPF